MKKINQKYYKQIIYFLIGFTTIISQVIYIREFMISFYGNELTIGIILAFWLCWIALGSISYNKIFKNLQNHLNLLPISLLLISLLLPVTIYSIRIIRSIFTLVPGEIPGLLHSISSAAIILAPICILSGAFFALASKIHSQDNALSTSTVYKYEAIGSAIGGMLLSFVLLGNLNSFQIILFISFVNILLAFVLIWEELSNVVKVILIILCVLFTTFSGHLGKELHLITTLSFWKNYIFVESKDSVYGHLSVIEIDGEKSIYSNGIKIVSSGDVSAVEERVHYVMLQHPNPEKILFIGSSHPDIFNEILEYETVTKIDYVEIDPVITELSQKYFAEAWQLNKKNKKINLINRDGRFFVKQTEDIYDIIIVNTGDPLNANINRFYTVEFFKEINSILAKSGIFTFQLSGSENYLSKELIALLKIINKSLREVFNNTKIIPGENIHYFAANEIQALNLEAGFLINRLEKRGIDNQFVNEYYLYFRLLPTRIQEVQKIIQPETGTFINKDFHPIAYFFNLAFWSSQFSPFYSSVSQFINEISYKTILFVMIFTMVMYFVVFWLNQKKQRFLQNNLKMAVFIMGVSLITFEIIVILGFQAIYGYIYNQMAALIGFFMAGIAVGSGFFLKQKLADVNSYLRRLSILHIMLAFLPLLVLGVFKIHLYIFNQMTIFLFTILCGAIGGYQFPLASRIYFSFNKQYKQNIGILYGMDILGAMSGTIILGVICIPLFGFLQVALIILILNLLISIFMLFCNKSIKLY
jgi:spermidine synthase